ncbi:AsnC family transcriptional regulator [Halosegnis sp.]|uniref:AsnC family transcriptional regulator n=1 Tax=Halosegnis sp. TaxID=2864959 RepID=UPI0035D4D6C0
MNQPDETDLRILSLLTEDARRPFSDIAEEVGLSGPAVSDRVSRLREAGVIEGFTVEVDAAALRAGAPVFVRVDPNGGTERLRGRLADEAAVEHVFTTADGDVWFTGRTDARDVRAWVESLVEGADYSVTLLDSVEWHPTFDATGFAVSCDECGNTVDEEGESTRIDGDVYHFCCGSCRGRFEERYRSLADG